MAALSILTKHTRHLTNNSSNALFPSLPSLSKHLECNGFPKEWKHGISYRSLTLGYVLYAQFSRISSGSLILTSGSCSGLAVKVLLVDGVEIDWLAHAEGWDYLVFVAGEGFDPQEAAVSQVSTFEGFIVGTSVVFGFFEGVSVT